MKLTEPLHFFLGANSPSGFAFLSEGLTSLTENGRLFLLKGGPGTGKSTLIRAAAETLSEREPGFEYIHCSSDPDSLDAVIFPESRTALTDATAPHILEPKFPGACETVVPLSSCWDEASLQKKRAEILSLSHQISGCHQQCVRFLNAAESLLSDSRNIALSCTDPCKIAKTAANILARECRRHHTESEEKLRLLTAVTPQGFIGLTQTAAAFPRIYLLRDPYGASSALLLSTVRSLLLDFGISFYTCFDPLCPREKIDHILVPEYGLAFITESRAMPREAPPEPYRVISFSRFTELESLARRRQRLRFNHRAAGEILDAAVRSMRRAKLLHDALEAQYAEAVDFSAVEALSHQTVETAAAWQSSVLS